MEITETPKPKKYILRHEKMEHWIKWPDDICSRLPACDEILDSVPKVSFISDPCLPYECFWIEPQVPPQEQSGHKDLGVY